MVVGSELEAVGCTVDGSAVGPRCVGSRFETADDDGTAVSFTAGGEPLSGKTTLSATATATTTTTTPVITR
jgi:hypothetical protein